MSQGSLLKETERLAKLFPEDLFWLAKIYRDGAVQAAEFRFHRLERILAEKAQGYENAISSVSIRAKIFLAAQHEDRRSPFTTLLRVDPSIEDPENTHS